MQMAFTTDQQPLAERFDYWHEMVFRAYARCVGVVPSRRDFSAALQTGDFGPVELSRVSSSPIDYARRACDLRSGPRDDVFAALLLDGATGFEQGDRRIIQRPGDVLFYDAGRPYAYHCAASYSAVLMRVPRAALASRAVAVDRLGGVILPGGSVLGRLVGTLLRESMQMAATFDASAAADVAPAVVETIAAALRQSAGDGVADLRGGSAVLMRIKRFLRDNLGDADLTLDVIATRQGVSLRTLSRLFAAEGTTPMRWLQQARLDNAHRALAERRVRSVTEAAFASGFNDHAHFTRLFRRAYGITPKSLLAPRGG